MQKIIFRVYSTLVTLRDFRNGSCPEDRGQYITV